MLSTFIKLQFVSKIFVMSIFEWSLKTGFTVYGMGILKLDKQLILSHYLLFKPNSL